VQEGNAAVRRLLAGFEAANWIILRKPLGREFRLTLPESVATLRLGGISAKLRKHLARMSRRVAQELGGTIVHHSGLDRGGWEKVIRHMGVVERASWVGRSGGFLHFDEGHNARFWLDCLSDKDASEGAHAFVLYRAEDPMAFEFCFDSGKCRYFLAGLHLPSTQAYSPGSLLMQLMLEDAIARGMEVVNMGLGDAGYKSRWGAKPSELKEDWLVLRPGPLARAASGVWWTLRTSRTILQSIRGGTRRGAGKGLPG
jgi:CelD/BcsL family acetyltransferase involved in cellulose biosynthesis